MAELDQCCNCACCNNDESSNRGNGRKDLGTHKTPKAHGTNSSKRHAFGDSFIAQPHLSTHAAIVGTAYLGRWIHGDYRRRLVAIEWLRSMPHSISISFADRYVSPREPDGVIEH